MSAMVRDHLLVDGQVVCEHFEFLELLGEQLNVASNFAQFVFLLYL